MPKTIFFLITIFSIVFGLSLQTHAAQFDNTKIKDSFQARIIFDRVNKASNKDAEFKKLSRQEQETYIESIKPAVSTTKQLDEKSLEELLKEQLSGNKVDAYSETGCRDTVNTKYYYSWTGMLIHALNNRIYYCWNQDKITYAQVTGRYPSNVAYGWEFVGITGTSDYYSYYNRVYNAYTQGTFRLCIPSSWGCYNYNYANIKSEAYRGGYEYVY